MKTDTGYQPFLRPLIDAGVVQVFLLGTVSTSCSAASVFEPLSPPAHYAGHPYFLALTAGRDERGRTELQDRLEHKTGTPPHTLLVLDHNQFYRWREEGHPFALRVVEKADCLYARPFDLPAPQAPVTHRARSPHTVSLVQEFLAGAELFHLRRQYRLAAFMLHQAAEHSLHGLMRANTGLHINTHNLERLLRYCLLFCPALAGLFAGSDAPLLPLLQKAYVDARYQSDYAIGEAQVRVLMQKVRSLAQWLRQADQYRSEPAAMVEVDG